MQNKDLDLGLKIQLFNEIRILQTRIPDSNSLHLKQQKACYNLCRVTKVML